MRLLIVILLAAIATCLLIEVGLTTSSATAQVSAGSGPHNVFAISGKITSDTYGLYLVDTSNATICVYQFLPNTKQFALVAARTYRYDSQLDDYKNAEPVPREIKRLVQQQRRLDEVAPGG